jgi:hypothetical protein
MSGCDIAHNDIDNDDNKNNGLITKIWGGAGWTFNHCVTFGYPIEPTKEQKKQYKQYFISLGDVLPCKYCRESYKQFITQGESALTDDVLKNRKTLTMWFYHVHNTVNNKLDVEYNVSYEDVVNRYESFRAKCGVSNEDSNIKGCVTPLDYKAFSYRKLYQLDCPIIRINYIKPYIILAKMRKLDPDCFKFYKLVNKINGDINILKTLECWTYRNMYCQKQIRYMREHGIASIETTGKWKDTPTVDELKLILYMSSNMCKKDIQDIGHLIIKKLGEILQ